MNRSLVIGKTNVGKTLFCIHFARYVGIREFQWLVERTDGSTERKRMTLAEAERALSDPAPHYTRHLQSLLVEVPRGKGARQLLLTDTTGLTEGIHPNGDIRQAMAQTLHAMLEADIILHIVDAADVGRKATVDPSGFTSAPNSIDEQLAEFGCTHDGYLMLANKIDLPEAKYGYQRLCKHFTRHRVVPVSALLGTGFREVKQHVWRFA